MKKLLTLIISLIFISMASFCLFQLLPGDPTTTILGTGATREQTEALQAELGLNDPVLVRYGRWLLGMFQGDMGRSYQYDKPVAQLLASRIPVSLSLVLLSVLILLAISIPLGVFLGGRINTRWDFFCMNLAQVLMCVPQFFMGIILTLIFGVSLRMFTPGKFISYEESIPGFLRCLFWPALAIALPKVAMVVRFLRNAIGEELNRDYVRTAYAKGLSRRRVLYGHVLKNAWIPVLSVVGIVAADMVAGSIVVEQVFSLPGIGRLLISSISNRDYPVVAVLVVFIAAVVMIMNHMIDVLYAAADPRIRRSKG